LTFVDINALNFERNCVLESNARLDMALRINNIAWWEYYVVTGHVDYSPNKATMLGYTEEEFPNDVYEICSLIHPGDYDTTMQNMKDHLEGKTSQWNTTYRVLKKDGSYGWYHDQGVIVERDLDGKPVKLMGTVTDVSRLEDENRQ